MSRTLLLLILFAACAPSAHQRPALGAASSPQSPGSSRGPIAVVLCSDDPISTDSCPETIDGGVP